MWMALTDSFILQSIFFNYYYYIMWSTWKTKLSILSNKTTKSNASSRLSRMKMFSDGEAVETQWTTQFVTKNTKEGLKSEICLVT